MLSIRILLALLPSLVLAAAVTKRATNIPVITAGATYTYPQASDPGAPVATTVAGLIVPGTPDLNFDAADGVVEHVLLLSYDGFHQCDLDYYAETYPQSTLASLVNSGVEYTNAKASSPSDSFPGAQAYMTGASSRTHGVYYDVSYDRQLYPPGSNCEGPQGTVVAYDETIDVNSTDVTGGGAINGAMLPLYKTQWGTCAPVYPNNFVRVNNMFEVARFQSLKTCYTDKHPAYTIARGPSGLGLSEDYFPEINAYSSQSATEGYDDLHWSALKNWTLGKHYDGSEWTEGGAPAIYGGNFQAISVSEKSAGYTADLKPSANLEQALRYMDTKLGELVSVMKSAGTFDTTLIILTAKHGQSPIDRSELLWIDPDALINATGVAVPGNALDDGGYLWLANNSDTQTAVDNLLALKSELHIDSIYYGDSAIAQGFGDARYDSRAPDIIIKTEVGVIFSGGGPKKTAEHGGLNPDDLDVALLVSHPAIKAGKDDRSGISIRQIAPTALKALGLDPMFLEGVRRESTPVLPGLPF